MRTLVVTVGGSHEPIVTSANSLRPDRVVFLCTTGKFGSRGTVDGEGKPCKVFDRGAELESRPNLVAQLGIQGTFRPEADVAEIQNPDDPVECYAAAARVLDSLRDDGQEVLVDYTGGTKTMSFGLAAAALDRHLAIHLTSRERTNLQRVEYGAYTDLLDTSPIHVTRALDLWLPDMLESYNYPAAVRLLQRLSVGSHLRGVLRERVQVLRDVCGALEAWDRFDHAEAHRLLAYRKRYPPILEWSRRLERLLACRRELDGAPPESSRPSRYHGYELVEDLLLNAERRAAQGRYDDAVGRVYRALELLAQVRLRKAHCLQTGRLRVEDIPEAVRQEVMKGADPGDLRVGLFKAYILLSGFPGDPVGELFAPRRGDIQNALEARNTSLFAHGFAPLDQSRWRDFHSIAVTFLTDCLQAILGLEPGAASQLPGPLLDLSK